MYESMTSIKNKYISSMVLHGLGDTIGFKNGDWKTNYDKNTTIGTILEYSSEFIDLGGINGISLDGWYVSANTLYHEEIADALLQICDIQSVNNMTDKSWMTFKNGLILAYNRNDKDEYVGETFRVRMPNNLTQDIMQKFTEETDGRTFEFEPKTYTNDCATRSLAIGLAYHNNLEMLIHISIMSGMMTHNSPAGFLGGLTVAYFAYMGANGIDLYKWPTMLIKLLESENVTKYINKKRNDVFMNYVLYLNNWKDYVDTRFLNDEPIKTRAFKNLAFRIRYYWEHFVRDTPCTLFGVSSWCVTIMAYDGLIDCGGIWEKLIFYTMLNPADTSAVGSIAGGLYGLLYEFGDVTPNMLEHLEDKLRLEQCGAAIYDKFH
jgi:ADP-ribosylarginine hydrolase